MNCPIDMSKAFCGKICYFLAIEAYGLFPIQSIRIEKNQLFFSEKRVIYWKAWLEGLNWFNWFICVKKINYSTMCQRIQIKTPANAFLFRNNKIYIE